MDDVSRERMKAPPKATAWWLDRARAKIVGASMGDDIEDRFAELPEVPMLDHGNRTLRSIADYERQYGTRDKRSGPPVNDDESF